MSRSGYSDECDDHWRYIMWRGAVSSALRGARGQAFLREMVSALDAMPDKVLATEELQHDGAFCALGVVGAARGVNLSRINTESWAQLAETFGLSQAMAREIMFENDECFCARDPDAGRRRWAYMRHWAASNLVTP